MSNTDLLGNVTTYAYNDLGEPVTTTQPGSITTTDTYDTDGQLLSQSLPNPSTGAAGGPTTAYAYDDFGNQVSQSLPDPANGTQDSYSPTTTDTFDLDGQSVSTTDPMDNTTAYAYDAFGNEVSQSLPDQWGGEQDPWSPTTTFTYDGDGDVLSLTDPDQNTTSWTYDAAGDQTSQSKIAALGYNSDGSVEQQTATDTYYYDLDQNLASSQDADGNTSAFTYDTMNHELSDTLRNPDNSVSDTYAFSYDTAGHMTGALNNAAAYSYEIGPSGNLDLENVQIGDLPNVVLASTYDNNGNRLTLAANIGGTMAGGTVTADTGYYDFENAYKYDALGQMTLVVQESFDALNGTSAGGDTPAAKVAKLSYNADGLVSGIDRYDLSYSMDTAVTLSDLNPTVGGVHIVLHLRLGLESDRLGL